MRAHAIAYAERQVRELARRSLRHRDLRTWMPLAIQCLPLTEAERVEVFVRVYMPEFAQHL